MNKTFKLISINVTVALILTILGYLVGLTVNDVALLPDQGATWYLWKLPNPTWITRSSAWIGYALHQVALWYVIIKMGQAKLKPTFSLTKFNIQLIVINIVFILFHMLQTMVWYDGLAQDVPVSSSQYSVILMLVLILIMENGRRGLFFGKKVKLPVSGVKTIFNYHGFYISWAVTYTFWFHPLIGTAGHLIGFFYTYLLFIQLSLSGTKYHMNRLWTFLLEITVLFHGTTVAILQGTGIWSMFFFGFATMFIVTQMYGLNLSKKWKIGLTTFYGAFAIFVYSGIYFDKQIYMIHQVLWIPIILYGLVFVIAYVSALPSLFRGKKQ